MKACISRSVCIAAAVAVLMPLVAQAQLCVGRPGTDAHRMTAGTHLQSGDKSVTTVPRVGVTLTPVFATVGIGNRAIDGGGNAMLYQGELGIMFGGNTPQGAQWCPIFRAERQQWPNNDVSSNEIQYRSENYRLGWSFGDVLGGTVEEPSPYVFVGSFAYERGWSSIRTPVLNNYSSESTVGFVVGIGLHVMLRSWLSIGANTEIPLWAAGSKPPLGISVATSF